ncbi:MAG TPA: type II secretion system protein GspC [Polyangiaceae bacterium]|jgi:general secretion pathway protein C|nr:type II secretion system protein GspC [Polyangiaceae bacterium]
MRRRPLLPLVLGTLAVCAWLQARGFSALLGGGLAAPPLSVLREARAATEPPPPISADPILARNPFDSVTGPLLGVPAAPAAEGNDGPVQACEGVRVVSIVAADDPDWSLVVLDVRGERGPILRRRGGEVLGIAPDRVAFLRDGVPCVARIFAPPGAPPPSPAALARGIARTGPDSFALDRSARDALLDGAGDLMRSVMVRPEKQGDEVVGLRIAALQPGTPLDALGVRSGDVLVSVDGLALTSPDRMLEVYAKVRTEERIRVVVLRDGHPQQLDYRIR